MDDLIIRVLSGQASPFEVERLNRWRGEAEENERQFREIAQVWDLTSPEPRAEGAGAPTAREIIRAATNVIEETGPGGGLGSGASPRRTDAPRLREAHHPGRRLFRPRLAWGLLAASVAAVGLGTAVLWYSGSRPLQEHRAPAHQATMVTLDDGSLVRLAAGSVLRVWSMEGERRLSLQGRAFFAVTRDESRPFRVRGEAGEIRVLGTRFELAEEAGVLRTVVVEGRVAVSNRHGTVEVPAGSLARMSENEAPAAEVSEDLWALLDWPEGILVFQGTPLRQVAEEVSRHFGRAVTVPDSNLGGRRITAWFQEEGFGEVTEALCAVVAADCVQTDEGVVMNLGPEAGGGP